MTFFDWEFEVSCRRARKDVQLQPQVRDSSARNISGGTAAFHWSGMSMRGDVGCRTENQLDHNAYKSLIMIYKWTRSSKNRIGGERVNLKVLD